MTILHTVLRHFFTGKDNQSYDIMRALTAFSVLMMIGYIGYHLVVHKTFDPLASAGGLGALLFGAGVGTAAKDGGKLGGATNVAAGPSGNVTINENGEGG